VSAPGSGVSRRGERLIAGLRRFTPARIGLGRSGPALPTREVLALGLAHARARDAVHAQLDLPRLLAELTSLAGPASETPPALVVRTQAPDRATFLARPDLGRLLAPGEAARLGPPAEIVLVVADGLSAVAVDRHAVPLLAALRRQSSARWSRAPVVIALQARVAIGDAIGPPLRARLVAVLLGERPGLSSPDSLGVYLTFDPRPGRTDAERNCISNVRPSGLAYEEAARRVDWLAEAALSRSLTGFDLKDESDSNLGELP